MKNIEERASQYAQNALDEWKKEKKYGILRLMREAYLQGAKDTDSKPAWLPLPKFNHESK